MLRYFFFIILIFALPSIAHGYNQPYYAQAYSSRSGSEIVRFTAATRFVYERLYSDRADSGAFLCSVSKLLPENRGAAFLETAVQRVSEISGLSENDVFVVLTSNPCLRKEVQIKKKVVSKQLVIDKLGRVVSGNPVWNACIRNLPMTGVFVRSNPDTFLHRQRRVRVRIPLSCRDYHRGSIKVWSLPDNHSVHLVLDVGGRLLGDPPIGYVLKSE